MIRLMNILALAASLAAWCAPLSPQAVTPKKEIKPSASSDEIQRGKQVYDYRCAICHFPTSTNKKIGPGLKGWGTRTKFADGREITEEQLREVIAKGGKNMPAFEKQISADQMRDLLAYLKTL
ncbi:MAG: c-type cytochrome [Candidatus Acidiferrales bacterium]